MDGRGEDRIKKSGKRRNYRADDGRSTIVETKKKYPNSQTNNNAALEHGGAWAIGTNNSRQKRGDIHRNMEIWAEPCE